MSVRIGLQWKWFLGLAGLLAVLLAAVNIAIDSTLPSYLRDRIREDLTRDVAMARHAFGAAPRETAVLQESVARLALATGLRITLIARDGVVLADSDKKGDEVSAMENHLGRPEVQQALGGAIGSSIRHSDTLDVDFLYAAARLDDGGFVRVALPLHEVDRTTGHVERTVAWSSALVILCALPMVFWLSRRLTGPLDEMREMAANVAAGDFRMRAPERGGFELRELGAALNRMSDQLAAKLRELASEKAELQAILANMAEGVLVVDDAGHVRMTNDALRRLFALEADAIGRDVIEVFRNAHLTELIGAAVRDGQAAPRELTFPGREDRIFDVTAGRFAAGGRFPSGAVVVFHDITRIKKLESVRKDFVANVSHELRTPLSVIRGYVETLLEEPADGANNRGFLEIVDRHAKRLETLVSDLLAISELESQQARLHIDPIELHDVLDGVKEELAPRAAARNMAVEDELPADTPKVLADPDRLRQVFVNLMDNAIKYTQIGGRVRVTACRVNGDVRVTVSDNGPGIAAEHLPRIFERFYRVDKARSRELGGTGLGLSIVKHIVQAHGGRIWAESRVGQGTEFHFTLPVAKE